MNRAVFLDRDGVINKTIFKMGKPRAPYSLEEFAFIEGVEQAVEVLKAHGFLTVVVTNQPDVARGWVGMEQVELVNNFVHTTLQVNEVMSCFHTDKDNCECRKPRPGMILAAAKKWNIDLTQSFMVGDRLSDVDAGQRAGCLSILVGEGDGASGITPDHHCENLLSASAWILNHSLKLK
jgi:D-glycero-D-manno-heptose 1,7-bisphosphate phosphatase